MDILDIDEALKDDSYIFLAEKTNDDITNILQQWKANNQEWSQSQKHTNEQAYKLNSKTFTRPKRRSQASANLERQFAHISQAHNSSTLTATLGMLNLEIGGLVTNMHKSFLQDTSPPSSICSSINNGQMNNSLISSADFTNLSFLQSNISMVFTEGNDITEQNLTALISDREYTLSDIIGDRKVLESLSMSGDGTLIKDSHIGQIDDISLSKTASACSTMDNSTDSMSMPNEQQMHTQVNSRALLTKAMVMCDEMIGDTTFSLVDSLTTPAKQSPDEGLNTAGLKRPPEAHTPLFNETHLLEQRQENNTFTESCQSPEDAHCETPENVEKKLSSIHMQSTPLPTTTGLFQNYNNNINNNNNKQLKYTPKGREEITNISPIVGSTTHRKNYISRQLLDHNFEPQTLEDPLIRLELVPDGPNNQKFLLSDIEPVDKIEQPAHNATFNMSEEHKQKACVVNLANAEVGLIAHQCDEEQFEHMLAELGKVNALNADQLKMQKSLNIIKRRFHKDDHTIQDDQQQVEDLDHFTLKSSQSHLTTTNTHSNSQCIISGERLLNRRSRLYDDVKLSVMQNNNVSADSCNSTSFIVCRNEIDPLQKTEENKADVQVDKQSVSELACYKVAGRRTRDRERFKTIKLTKGMRAFDEQQGSIVVPCIDDEKSDLQSLNMIGPNQRQQSPCMRVSRFDQASSNYMTESACIGKASNNNLTLKKPMEKSWVINPHQHFESDQIKPIQARSLSRPRYIVDLKKLQSVSKAISAGAGLNAATSVNITSKATEAESSLGDSMGLASPMGIKSKSFHNLSSNLSAFVGGDDASALEQQASVCGTIRRPSVQTNKLLSGSRASHLEEQEKSSIFKVPILISGLRAPSVGGAKRAVCNGLARPSSGFYRLSVKAIDNIETPESLSSASPRSSLYCKDKKPNDPCHTNALSLKLTQVTTGATGIPKPSSLRRPTQIKRSGLPRPSTLARR